MALMSPNHDPRVILQRDKLIALEEGSDLCIVPNLTIGKGENEDMTYVLKSGDAAMKLASLKDKHKPAFILFPKLQE
jgi:hypothetical protein